jgi:uncharacterized protein YegP (UPF0339 family)
MFPKFDYFQSEVDLQWYFNLVDPSCAIIVQSAGYMTEEECIEGIELLRRFSDIAIVTKNETLAFC